MAGIYSKGETKVRPGIYFRTENGGGIEQAEQRGGIVAVAFQANWGPLGQVVELSAVNEIENVFGVAGDGANLDPLRLAFQGGATTVKAIRVGTGGTKAAITLKDTTTGTALNVITLTAKYAGTRAMSVTIRDSVADPTNLRECIIYSGTAVLTKVQFAKGAAEVDGLIAAIAANADSVVTATKVAAGNGTLAALTQTAFTTEGESPEIANSDYSAAFTVLEATSFDVLCVDSNDNTLHALVKAFVERVNEGGLLAIAVIGEATSTEYATRKSHLATYNSPLVVYCMNGALDADGNAVEGYKVAALVAGLIAAVPSSDSITHKKLPGMTGVKGALTNTQIEDCLLSGAIVITASSAGTPWIEQGVNTLVTLSADQDAGWKKIRRTKTRHELITRIAEATENVVGNVNNDASGRATIVAIAGGIIQQMIAEEKLVSGKAYEDPNAVATGDSAWFVIEVVDLDSIEKVYITYRFSFT